MKKPKMISLAIVSCLFLLEITSLAQDPIYDPFFEMFQLTMSGADREGRRTLTPDGKQIHFFKYWRILPSYKLAINVFLSPVYPAEGLEEVMILATIENTVTEQISSILADGKGKGTRWMERNWSYSLGVIDLSGSGSFEVKDVPEKIAKDQAKKFLDLWHGRGLTEPGDIPKSFY